MTLKSTSFTPPGIFILFWFLGQGRSNALEFQSVTENVCLEAYKLDKDIDYTEAPLLLDCWIGMSCGFSASWI